MKPGDVVRLRSGGLPMTVYAVNDNAVLCVWFNGSDELGWIGPIKEEFVPEDLVVVEATSKP